MSQTTMSDTQAAFGPFRFDRSSGMLLDGDNQVQLGSRARALLGALIDKPGELVLKAQLYERAWPGLQVDERNLRVQMSGLRKALGDYGALIRTEASLGYRFTGRLNSDNRPDHVAPVRPRRTPSLLVELLGRDEALGNIIDTLKDSRLVTVLGPGGIGKTTVALAVARRVEDDYCDGVHFVDLGCATDETQVNAALVDALKLSGDTSQTIEQVLCEFQRKRFLLVLDSCDHVAEHAAAIAEQVLKATERAVVLATSRESLRVDGEIVWRLEPLDVPPCDPASDATNLNACRSVQLFVKVAQQHAPAFRVDERNASMVAAICRRLDGIPLAIELVASMVGRLSLDDLHRGLDDLFLLRSTGQRSAVARHRSMSAAIAWSYDLLSAPEKRVLHSLTAFCRPFTLDDAMTVACDGAMRPDDVRNLISALANKSLLSVSQQVAAIEYRMLETTRAYLLQRGNEAQVHDIARAKKPECRPVNLRRRARQNIRNHG